MIATATEKNCGTLIDFLKARVRYFVYANDEEKEAFTKEFYNLALQLVLDNGYSALAQKTFPRIGLNVELTPQVISDWWRDVNVWYLDRLNCEEREMFFQMEVTWND